MTISLAHDPFISPTTRRNAAAPKVRKVAEPPDGLSAELSTRDDVRDRYRKHYTPEPMPRPGPRTQTRMR